MAVNINNVSYLTVAEIIHSLSISRQTFWRWRNSKKIPAGYRYRDGRIVYTEDEFELIKQHAHRLEALDEPRPQQMGLFTNSNEV
jgi:predicted DNA-binding transcriptional regulator AlpA